MAKDNKKDNKKKIKRAISKNPKKKPTKKDKKNTKINQKTKKAKNKDDYSQKDEDEEEFEDFILPGQKNSTPPAGDATRAFYESLLEQRPDSIMAKKYCVEYGCLDADKANEFLKELEMKKKKK